MAKKEIVGKVIFDLDEELNSSELNDKNKKELTGVIKKMWDSYLHTDKEGFSQHLSSDVRKMTQADRKLSDGAKAVLHNLSEEWTQFERPNNILAMEMTFREISIWADDESSPSYAIVHYWIEVEGGARWEFEDQGFVLQAFKKQDNTWKLVHHIDAWSTNYDLDEEAPGEEPDLLFEYAYPVEDMQRALKFYKPILGEPDFVNDTQAYFSLRDPGFFLDSSGLFGYAEVKKNKTNGYAIVRVKNLAKEIEKLKDNGVKFLAGTDSKPKKWNHDNIALIKDQDGNVVVITERNYKNSNGTASVNGFSGGSKFIAAAQNIAQSWMQKDAKKLAALHGKEGLWFDNSKIENRGLQEGGEDLSENLKKFYWNCLDHTEECIVGNWEAQNIKEVSFGDYTIVSYERIFTGKGNHPSKSKSYITHIFESPDSVALTMINNATVSNSMALDLDYTGHPVLDIEKVEGFYSEKMEWEDPYKDECWRGYWSDNSVYGLFEVEEEENLIAPERTNGYVSFNIASAEKIYAYLQEHKVQFPMTPSLNDKKGVDHKPGYTQVVATDSEENLVIFSEYTGKRK